MGDSLSTSVEQKLEPEFFMPSQVAESMPDTWARRFAWSMLMRLAHDLRLAQYREDAEAYVRDESRALSLEIIAGLLSTRAVRVDPEELRRKLLAIPKATNRTSWANHRMNAQRRVWVA